MLVCFDLRITGTEEVRRLAAMASLEGGGDFAQGDPDLTWRLNGIPVDEFSSSTP